MSNCVNIDLRKECTHSWHGIESEMRKLVRSHVGERGIRIYWRQCSKCSDYLAIIYKGNEFYEKVKRIQIKASCLIQLFEYIVDNIEDIDDMLQPAEKSSIRYCGLCFDTDGTLAELEDGNCNRCDTHHVPISRRLTENQVKSS